MTDYFYRLARKIRPDLDALSGQRRVSSVADLVSLFFSLPLLLIGLFWLVKVSDWTLARQNWPLVVLLGGLIFLYNRLSFYLVTEVRSGGYANTQGALDGMVLWTGLLVIGPLTIWLDVLWHVVNFLLMWRTLRTVGAAWSRTRLFITTSASTVLSMLVGWRLYLFLGGDIPMGGLVLAQIIPALAGILVQFVIAVVVHSGYIGYVIWAFRQVLQTSPERAIHFFGLAFILPALAHPFGILAAGLYIEKGLGVLIFFMIGLTLVALLARRLSQTGEASRQQSRQLEELEKLGRAILNAPPDASTLPEILKTHVPLMFASRGIAIWTSTRGTLLQEPADWKLELEPIWQWLQGYRKTRAFLTDEQIPWQVKQSSHEPCLVAPILDVVSGEPDGLVYLELQALAVAWDARLVAGLIPAVQSLSAQVASACHQARVYAETLAAQKTLQELALARRIQASFLPEQIPQLPGWQIAATLEPARQMAGDFYDFIELPENRLGILIADVADKGLGPALYMALSRTLIRTYAVQYPEQPALVLATVNQRILQDARANLFVTVFYAVLDPASGLLTYANAGHTPPYLVSVNPGTQTLRNTGMPLGIDEESTWNQETVLMNSRDVLLLYTDGVIDAQNSQGEFIDRKSVLEITSHCKGKSVEQIRQAILQTVHNFIGDAPRFDDITLVIVGRE